MQTPPTNSPALPAPIAGYFASEAVDADAVGRCFTNDAIVVDERHEHRGRAAIARWNAESNAKFGLTTDVLTAEVDGENVTVAAKVTGNFPGSPIELRFRFTLKGSLIRHLEIAA